MSAYSDYEDLLFSYNFTGNAPDTQAVPNLSLSTNSGGDLIIEYTVFQNQNDVNAVGYYSTYTYVTNEIATTTYKQNAEDAFLTIMNGNFGSHGAMFQDVAKITFQEDISGAGEITFGQLKGLYFENRPGSTLATTAFSVPFYILSKKINQLGS